MSGPTATASLTFSQAVVASGVTPRTLRGWLDRDQVELDLDGQREGAGWRRFSPADCVRLALTGTLVDYCVPVARAAEIARQSLSSHLHWLGRYQNTPTDALAALAEYVLFVWRDGEALSAVTGTARSLPDLGARAHYLFVDVGAIAAGVVARLKDLADE